VAAATGPGAGVAISAGGAGAGAGFGAFVATLFFGAAFFAATFFAATFLGAAFFGAAFFTAFLATFFFGAAFFTAFLATFFLGAAFLGAAFFTVRFFAICASLNPEDNQRPQGRRDYRSNGARRTLILARGLDYRPAVMSKEAARAVILARGLGTRMRRAAHGVEIDQRQARVADTGVKAMIPIGRPFLDFVLSGLADAGFADACLVIGPEHGAVRDYYTREAVPTRLRLHFAVQERPLGTADAVRAAEGFAVGGPAIVLNSDNYYPVPVLRQLRELGEPGLAGFEREALVRAGNIDDDRVARYAVLDVGPDGLLRGIVEKPDAATWARVGANALISMNCWRFGPAIFEAARRIRPSSRGELELADAVAYAMHELGETFRVVPVREGVLDLSMRADIPEVARRLADVEVRL